MRFSIIIPVYNIEKYINECLDSILLHTNNEDYEVICIDDHSADNSLKIIKEYEQKYSNIKVYENEKNLGVSSTRNRGLDLAKGEYIWFVDSDDRITENSLNIISNEINNSNADIICFNADIFTPNARRSCLPDFYEKHLKTMNKKTGWIGPFFLITTLWLCCIKNSFIKKNKIRFKENITIFEDWPFLWMLGGCRPVVMYLDNVLYEYRKDYGPSLMARTRTDMNYVHAIFSVWYELKEYLIYKNVYNDFERFCFIRANTIYYGHLNKKYTSKAYLTYINQYSAFLNDIHPSIYMNAINDYPLNVQCEFENIKHNTKINRIKQLAKKCKLEKYYLKLQKHVKFFIAPIKNFVRWIGEIFAIFFYGIKIIFKFLLNISSFVKALLQ